MKGVEASYVRREWCCSGSLDGLAVASILYMGMSPACSCIMYVTICFCVDSAPIIERWNAMHENCLEQAFLCDS